jgi:PST family polysaccharide transporter
MTARYGLSTFVNLGNMLVLTWWIGPRTYGVFVSAVTITTVLASLARCGFDIYLVRAEEDSREVRNLAFTLTAVASSLLAGIGLALTPWLRDWYREPTFPYPYIVLLLTVPLIGMAGPPMAILERQLRFREVASIELGGQFASFLVGTALAWRKCGIWAPVLGHVAWQSLVLIAALRAARSRFRLTRELKHAREMLAFGTGVSASLRVWQLRSLVNPLLVSRFAGPEGVAFVALAIRVAEGLSFVRTAAARVAIAALASTRHRLETWKNGLRNATVAQVVLLGVLLAGFGVAGPLVVPWLLGERWAPMLGVYPFVAAAVLMQAAVNLEVSALIVAGRQWAVTRAYLWNVFVLLSASIVLVPRFGISAYGWAEVAACVTFFGIHRELRKLVSISFGPVIVWLIPFLILCSWPLLPAGWRALSIVPLAVLLARWFGRSVGWGSQESSLTPLRRLKAYVWSNGC